MLHFFTGVTTAYKGENRIKLAGELNGKALEADYQRRDDHSMNLMTSPLQEINQQRSDVIKENNEHSEITCLSCIICETLQNMVPFLWSHIFVVY
ncbi:hypothetical protein ACE1TI_11545 [Alteribacillus sp. JSM 102045]|uniref:hypothetical protein n=1 Tax=Alteribacillus sp. JSM 102045 TaxID=1562101 RepID=UPI0035C0F7AC